MKRLIILVGIIVAMISVLSSCNPIGDSTHVKADTMYRTLVKQEAIEKNETAIGMKLMEVHGHYYVVVFTGDGVGVCHQANCGTCAKEEL